MSKSKKRLIVIFSIIGVLVVLMVVFGALFSLRRVSVDYATYAEDQSSSRIIAYQEDEVIEASKIKMGKNLLFADFDKVEARLEKAFPYARFNIVRNFPDKIIIYMYERTPVFKVLDEDGFYNIYDEELKCLEKVSPANYTVENGYVGQVPTLHGVEFNKVSVGELANNDYLKGKIKTLLDGVYAVDAMPINIMSDITFQNNDVLGFNELVLKINDELGGAKIVIQGEEVLKEKIAYAVYIYMHSVSQSTAEHASHLDKVTVTVLKNFTNTNKTITIACAECVGD